MQVIFIKNIFHHYTVYEQVDFYGIKLHRACQHIFYSYWFFISGGSIYAAEALLHEYIQLLFNRALVAGNKGHYKLHLRSLWQRLHVFHHVRYCIFFHLAPTYGRVGFSNTGKKQAEVVVYLRHAADRTSWSAGSNFLLNGYCRTNAADVVHIRLIHAHQKLPCVGAEAFGIAALPLGKKRIHGERRLSAATNTGHHHKLVAGDGHIHIFEVVHPRAFYKNNISVVVEKRLLRSVVLHLRRRNTFYTIYSHIAIHRRGFFLTLSGNAFLFCHKYSSCKITQNYASIVRWVFGVKSPAFAVKNCCK